MNIQKMLKQAQEMQAKLAEAQAKAEVEEIEGQSGGGMVKVKINGKGSMLGITLDAKLIDPNEKEMLEDLIVAAFNDAKNKSDSSMSDAMGKITAGMQLPPGFKMPF